jgi:hypothetical protein
MDFNGWGDILVLTRKTTCYELTGYYVLDMCLTSRLGRINATRDTVVPENWLQK